MLGAVLRAVCYGGRVQFERVPEIGLPRKCLGFKAFKELASEFISFQIYKPPAQHHLGVHWKRIELLSHKR